MIASDCQRIVPSSSSVGIVRLRIQRDETPRVRCSPLGRVDGHGFVVDAFQVQRNPHAERGRAAKERIELHRQLLRGDRARFLEPLRRADVEPQAGERRAQRARAARSPRRAHGFSGRRPGASPANELGSNTAMPAYVEQRRRRATRSRAASSPKSPLGLCAGFGTSTSVGARAAPSTSTRKSKIGEHVGVHEQERLEPSSGSACTMPPAVSSGGSPSSL